MKKILSLAVMVILCMSITVFADNTNGILIAPNPTAIPFEDMPNDWSTEAIQKAVDDGLIKGHNVYGKIYIKASDNLTRAELATVINRVFNSTQKADISSVQDIDFNEWYVEDIAKSVAMGVMMLDTTVRPDDSITRQEAFTMLARAFNLTSDNIAILDMFTDKDDILYWAVNPIAALVEKGYAQGDANKINPTDNMTRAEFATVITKMVEQYIKTADEYEITSEGNVVVNVPNAVIKNSTIKGDLIIADGVGQGDVTIYNTKVEGRLVVRGGGENSIKITGKSKIGTVTIVKSADGGVRVFAEDGTTIEVVTVDTKNDNIIIEGTFSNIIVISDNANITMKNAEIESISIESANVTIETDKNTNIKKVDVSGEGTKVAGEAKITNINVNANNTNVEVKDAKVIVSDKVEGTTVFDQKVDSGKEVIAKPADAKPSSGGGTTTTVPTVTIAVNNGVCELSKNKDFSTSDLTGNITVNNNGTQTYTLSIGQSPTNINSSSSVASMVDLLFDLDGVLETLTDVINKVDDPNLIISKLGDLKTWITSSTYNSIYADAIQIVISELQTNTNFMSGDPIQKSDLYDILQAVLTTSGKTTGDSVYDIATSLLSGLSTSGLSINQVWNDIISILNGYIHTV